MNLETVIQEKVHALPTSKQVKVLEFVEDLTIEKINEHDIETENKPEIEQKSKRYSFVGIGRSETGDLSARAEEILEKEIKRRSGWSLKDDLID